MPLADGGGGVALVPEGLGQRDLRGRNARRVLGMKHAGQVHADGIAAGQNGGARRGAGRGGHIELGQPDTLARHPVQVRSRVTGAAERSDVGVAKVVGHDQDHVGFRRSGNGGPAVGGVPAARGGAGGAPGGLFVLGNGARGLKEFLRPGHHVRMPGRDIVLLARIAGHVIEFGPAPPPDRLPFSHPEGLLEARIGAQLRAVDQLPVEVLVLGSRVAPERGHNGKPVEPFRRPDAGQLGGRGKKIPEGPDPVADRPRLHQARRPDDHRHPDAALIEVALDPPEGAVAVVEIRMHAPFPVGAVIAGEEDDGAVLQSGLAEAVENPTHLSVHAGDHGRLVLFRLGPVAVRIGGVVRNLHAVARLAAQGVVSMGNGIGEKEEPGRLVLSRHELQGGAGEEIGRVGAGFQGQLFPITPEMGRRVVVGIPVGHVDQRLIETVALGSAGTIGPAEPPLAENGRPVARRPEQVGHGPLAGTDIGAAVVPDEGVSGVLAQQQGGAGGGADGAARIGLGETDPFGRHPIEAGRENLFLPVAAEVAVAQVVGQNEEDIGPGARLRGRGPGQGGRRGQRQQGQGGWEKGTQDHVRVAHYRGFREKRISSARPVVRARSGIFNRHLLQGKPWSGAFRPSG